jgi:hypothetical protein
MQKSRLVAILFAIFWTVFLFACTAGADEPAAQEVDETAASEAARGAEEEATHVPARSTATPTADAREDEPATAAPEGAVTPVEVDANKVTPARRAAGVPIEAPEPGVANPRANMVHRAAQDLAKRLTIDISQITLLSVKERQWRDSSLGCPKPGMNYLMVITPGYEILLQAGGEIYEYHTNLNSTVVLCGSGDAPVAEPENPTE